MWRRGNSLAEARQEIIDVLRQELDDIRKTEHATELMVQIERLKGEIALLKSHKSELQGRLAELNAMRPSTTPLHWSEEQEDANFLLSTGRIDKSQYEEMLASAGFANTEIDFDPSISFPS